MFKKPFSFEGCIDKSEFRLSFVISFAGMTAVRIIGNIVDNTIIFLIVGIPVCWALRLPRVRKDVTILAKADGGS